MSRYLRANPLACDTCEGIGRWWMGIGPMVSLDALEEALDWMVAHRLLERLPAADGRVRYRRASLDRSTDDTLRQLAENGDPGRLH